jgi:hypothetical protein
VIGALVKRDKRFGTVAVEMGFITKEQLLQAMDIQIQEDIETGDHRLIGMILVEIGAMTDRKQVKEVLLAMGVPW